MYKVRTYNRSNGTLVSESEGMGFLQAMEIARLTGMGEGYWVEVIRLIAHHKVTVHSTV